MKLIEIYRIIKTIQLRPYYMVKSWVKNEVEANTTMLRVAKESPG